MDMEITVIDWIRYGSDKEDAPVGGMGGWFNAHLMEKFDVEKGEMKENPNLKPPHTWEDYVGAHNKESHPYLEALKLEIVSNNIQATGDQHQNQGMTPLFSDNTVGEFSYRSWGDLMAAIYTTQEEPLTYMAYYC
jgi:predicted esterase YcpF (UPF0227 family)